MFRNGMVSARVLAEPSSCSASRLKIRATSALRSRVLGSPKAALLQSISNLNFTVAPITRILHLCSAAKGVWFSAPIWVRNSGFMRRCPASISAASRHRRQRRAGAVHRPHRTRPQECAASQAVKSDEWMRGLILHLPYWDADRLPSTVPARDEAAWRMDVIFGRRLLT
jgi:hypothetical protein